MAEKIINIDEMRGIDDTIVLRIDGKTYTVPDFKADRINRIQDLEDETAEGERLHTVLRKQLGAALDVDPDEFLEVDARKLTAATKCIMEVLTNAGESRKRRERPRR